MVERVKSAAPSFVMMMIGIVILLIIPEQVRDSQADMMGPRFFPSLLASAVILFSVISVLQTLFIRPILEGETSGEVGHDENLDEPKNSRKEKVQGYIKIAIAFAILILWMVLVPIVGFVLTTILTIASLMYLLGNRSILFLILIPISITLLIYFIFVIMLSVSI